MPADLSNTLSVAVSARALFDPEEDHRFFERAHHGRSLEIDTRPTDPGRQRMIPVPAAAGKGLSHTPPGSVSPLRQILTPSRLTAGASVRAWG